VRLPIWLSEADSIQSPAFGRDYSAFEMYGATQRVISITISELEGLRSLLRQKARVLPCHGCE
jgi:hypothetical protein